MFSGWRRMSSLLFSAASPVDHDVSPTLLPLVLLSMHILFMIVISLDDFVTSVRLSHGIMQLSPICPSFDLGQKPAKR